MTDAVQEIKTIRELIQQAERAVGLIEKLLPPGNASTHWLAWRHRQLQQQLDRAKRELRILTDTVQTRLVEEVVEDKRANGK